jgi:hypothetical protein
MTSVLSSIGAVRIVIAKRKISRARMQQTGAKIAHFTDFLHMLMSTRKYLLYARMWKIKPTVARLAKGIHCKNTRSQAIYKNE